VAGARGESSAVADLVSDAARAIGKSRAIDHWQASLARYDAEELMGAVIGEPLNARLRRSTLTGEQRRRFARMVARRLAGEPVPRIVGSFIFRGLDLRMREGVFVPRNSSELLAAEAVKALRRSPQPRTGVDVATGAGPVALAMASEVRSAEVWGVDISAAAVALGRVNARRLQLDNAHFRVSDLLAGLPRRLRGTVDVITIHPPYVARSELRTLPREIREFEPVHSLTDQSTDGLGLVRRLAVESQEWLRPGGKVLVEIGTYLSRRTQAIFRHAGLVDVSWTRDSLGVTRVIAARSARARR
jgi:release factor glutamine methyltransferase